MRAFELTVDPNTSIATLVFDLPGEKVNKLSGAVVAELDAVLDDVKSRSDIAALVVRSGKPGVFIAGADIAELESITSHDDAIAKSRAGQKIFHKLSTLGFPTIAVIDGACLGGGLELALACTYRVATDSAKTKIGLPEVNLGIIPGWGGTWRLPKLIGFVGGLTAIVSGRALDGKRAWRMGIVDDLVSEAFQDERVPEFITGCLTRDGADTIAKRRARGGMKTWLLERNPAGRALAARKARATVLKKTNGHYPAPLCAIEAVKRAYGKSAEEAFDIEATLFGSLADGPIAKNLIQLFYTNEALKRERGTTADVAAKPVESAGVLGAGVMGGGIAWLFASRDKSVRMKDLAWDAIAKGFQTASSYFHAMVKRRKLRREAVRVKMHRISGTTDYSGFQNLDVVVEAVVENMDVKKTVLRETEAVVSDDTILATNTSSLSVDEMAGALERPERFVGLHFFNPVNRMPLVEVIAGEKTSPEVVATTVAMVKALGKTPIVVGDCAGFLVNRILVPYMNEAAYLLGDGAKIEQIDSVIKRFGMPMGPLELADEVGIDVGAKVAQVLAEAYGDRMAVSPALTAVRAEDGLLGKKAGRGFYVHQGKRCTPNPAIATLLSPPSRTAPTDDEIVDRTILTMVNEAARCLDEGIVERADFLDMAMIMGTGFPAFRGGLLRYADERGIEDVVATLRTLAGRDPRFAPCAHLERMAREHATFYDLPSVGDSSRPRAEAGGTAVGAGS